MFAASVSGLHKLGARYERAPNVHQTSPLAHEFPCTSYLFLMFYGFFSTVDMSVDVSEHTSSERESQSQKNILLFVRCSCFLSY